MSGAGASDQTGGSETDKRAAADAPTVSRSSGEMLSRSQGGGPNTSAGKYRQNPGRVSPAVTTNALPPDAATAQVAAPPLSRQQSFSQAQARAYGQHSGYQWYQPQRQGPYHQGQMSAGSLTPYGWLPYNVGYQIYGEQPGQQGYFQEGQPLTSYQLPYASQHAIANYAMGSGSSAYMQQPYFPHMLPLQQGRGLALRAAKASEEPSDSYNFDLNEARDNPERARTTLMLRNIPNKYTIHMLLDMLDKCHKRDANELVYDFCYLPIDFKNRCNLGYAFVNFMNAAYTAECYSTFNAKRWNDFNSKKVCEVKYARVQGREALIDHFRNSKFPSNDVDCLPLLFEKIVTETGEEVVRSVPLHSRQTT